MSEKRLAAQALDEHGPPAGRFGDRMGKIRMADTGKRSGEKTAAGSPPEACAAPAGAAQIMDLISRAPRSASA